MSTAIDNNHVQDPLEDILKLTEAGEDPTEFRDEGANVPVNPQKNPRFRDMEETGGWGELQRKEIYGLLVCGTLIVISVAAILSWISFSTAKESEVSRERAKLDAILGILQERNHSFIEMPSDISFYGNVADDESSPAYHRAMKWFLSDTYDLRNEFFLRFVLSSLYFDLGGEAWKNTTNWLTGVKTCDWFGVECDLGNKQHFQGLNLDNNNLVGTLPSIIGMLGNVSNIWLSDNQLSGTIPGTAFAKLSKLAVLFLDNNRLSGMVPESLSNLGILYVQENNLTGPWPFCRLVSNETKKYERYGFDCDKITCSEECCEDMSCYKSFGARNQ
ncbi:unnamed protein product [Cylindrotheca closterium]|uniref:Leucine-rich repeat-containing N-terminal plant-type domain-containing protein n=1 Tax=Cylindrotheca closterium TaxID=2856 RepID=A0AAD2CM54_9STRA|nr:unnamed protein product [Cylindrotheca closterium]